MRETKGYLLTITETCSPPGVKGKSERPRVRAGSPKYLITLLVSYVLRVFLVEFETKLEVT